MMSLRESIIQEKTEKESLIQNDFELTISANCFPNHFNSIRVSSLLIEQLKCIFISLSQTSEGNI